MKQRLMKPLSFFAVLLLAGTGAFLSFSANQYKTRLANVYRGAVLTAIERMEDMEHTLNKVLLSENTEAAAGYLAHVSDSAGQAQRSLSLLPLSHPDTMQAMKMTNQLADYAQSLLQNGTLAEEDAAQLHALTETCKQYAQILYNNEETLSSLSAKPASFYPAQGGEALDAALSYPTLIYDGPFSDARKESPLPLKGEEITWQQAADIAIQFVGENSVRSVSHGADIRGVNPCHGVTLTLDDVTLEAAVTKQEGKVLWISPDTAAFDSLVTIEQCRTQALSLLERNGFPPMESTGFQVYEGVAVLSFAPVERNVLLYPDLVKVQLRMDTAQPVGLETHGYRQNHRERENLTPALPLQDARQHLSPLLQPTAERLCLIPKDGREILCWEFACSYENGDYLLYINAHTGVQEEVLQIIESDTGIGTV